MKAMIGRIDNVLTVKQNVVVQFCKDGVTVCNVCGDGDDDVIRLLVLLLNCHVSFLLISCYHRITVVVLGLSLLLCYYYVVLSIYKYFHFSK